MPIPFVLITFTLSLIPFPLSFYPNMNLDYLKPFPMPVMFHLLPVVRELSENWDFLILSLDSFQT